MAFVAVLSVLALASADQVHHRAVKLGNAPTVTTTIAKAHGAHAAAVHSQPSAQPSEVNQYHNEEKYEAGNIAPVSPHAYKPAHKPAPYHEPAYEEPAVYKYGYAVADDYSGANFEANEGRDDYATSGSYRVALPDGRIQTVTYTVADEHSGVVMDVQYEGTPQYPEYHPPTKAVHAAHVPVVHAPHHAY